MVHLLLNLILLYRWYLMFGFTNGQSSCNNNDNDICITPGCVMAASNLLSAVDQSADPCNNFYQFACGKWIKDHPIPDDRSGYGTLIHVRETIKKQMRVLLENDDKNKSVSVKMAKFSYRACMNASKLSELKSDKLRNALEEFGYWPLLHGEKWIEKSFHLTNLLKQMRKTFGKAVFFDLYVYADTMNTTRNVLYIDQGSLSLGRGARDYYLNDTKYGNQINALSVYIEKVVILLAKDSKIDLKDVSKDIKDVIELERDIAKIIVPESERRNKTKMYNKRTIRDLLKMTPNINWLNYLRYILPKEVPISKSSEIIVSELDYMREISDLINKTNKRTLVNYILWRFVHTWVNRLDNRFDDIRQDFARVLTGRVLKPAKWKQCIPVPIDWMPLAAGSIYVKEHFKVNDKTEALEMIKHINEAFINLVQKLDWMDSQTKETAVNKANNILNNIGYPDFIIDDQKLDEYFAGLDIKRNDSYFDMIRKLIVWTEDKEFKKLLKVFDKSEFGVSPAVVNAFYSGVKNGITFPAAILQPPFFHGDYPKCVNYGAIGSVIGHEITHGFDDQGSQFDKDGNLHNWWHKDALKNFIKRKKCMIDQYSSYKEPKTGLFVNGKLTQGENIADNGGVKGAFQAYRKYVAELGHEEARLPGLTHFSNDQIFFLSFAHVWCGHKKMAAGIRQILTDEHSPAMFRVIGALTNFDDFSQAFNCKNESKSEKQKCVVW